MSDLDLDELRKELADFAQPPGWRPTAIHRRCAASMSVPVGSIARRGASIAARAGR
jgi:hypothetical protein